MEESKIRDALINMLTEVAEQAKADALSGKSNIGSVLDKNKPELRQLDEKQINQAIQDIRKATATKEGTARLVSALLVAARTIAAITIR
jgi:acetylglutamate kinase